MPFHAWRTTPRDLEPNPSLPAGMSRQSLDVFAPLRPDILARLQEIE